MEACFQAAAIGIRMVADKGVQAQWVSAEAFESPAIIKGFVQFH